MRVLLSPNPASPPASAPFGRQVVAPFGLFWFSLNGRSLRRLVSCRIPCSSPLGVSGRVFGEKLQNSAEAAIYSLCSSQAALAAVLCSAVCGAGAKLKKLPQLEAGEFLHLLPSMSLIRPC